MPAINEATLARDPTGLTLTWTAYQIAVRLSQFREARGGAAQSEVTVRAHLNGQERILTQGGLNLSSLLTRGRLAKRLDELHEGPPWNTIVEQTCVLGLREFREGEPIVSLEPLATDEPATFTLNPILYHSQPTLIYGPGDSGKSFWSLYCALLLAQGGSENGLCCSPHGVLYLDWELNAALTKARVRQLQVGQPHLTRWPRYRRCYSPLAEELDGLQRKLTDEDIQVVVVDSLALAAGAELEKAETAIRLFAALRSLNKTVLLIGHIAKHAEERTPFGSVFFYNLARSVWEVRKIQEPESGVYRMGLFHRKNNFGPKRKPMGFEVTITDDHAKIDGFDVSDDPELVTALPLPDQIVSLLKDGPARTVEAIQEALGAKAGTVRTILNRYKGVKWFRVTGGTDREGLWATLP